MRRSRETQSDRQDPLSATIYSPPYFNQLRGGISFKQNGIRYDPYPDAGQGYGPLLIPSSQVLSSDYDYFESSQNRNPIPIHDSHNRSRVNFGPPSSRAQYVKTVGYLKPHHQKIHGQYRSHRSHFASSQKCLRRKAVTLCTPPTSPPQKFFREVNYKPFTELQLSKQRDPAKYWDQVYLNFDLWINSRLQALSDLIE